MRPPCQRSLGLPPSLAVNTLPLLQAIMLQSDPQPAHLASGLSARSALSDRLPLVGEALRASRALSVRARERLGEPSSSGSFLFDLDPEQELFVHELTLSESSLIRIFESNDLE